MTATVVAPAAAADGVGARQRAAWLTGRKAARTRYPARAEAEDWAATRQSREWVLRRLHQPPFALDNAKRQQLRSAGLTLLLDWLADQPGRTWQQRWMSSGADAARANWRTVPTCWLRSTGTPAWRQELLSAALWLAIGADVLRPSLAWLVSKTTGKGLVSNLTRCRDSEGFARLRTQCAADPGVSPIAAKLIVHRGAVIVAAKGGTLADITIGDVLELLDIEAESNIKPNGGGAVFYRLLHRLGIFGADAPRQLREVRTLGQRTPEQLIDRYQLACRPVRDLLVDYLRERQPALDYTQPGGAGLRPGQTVLAGPRTPPPRHRQPAPAGRGRRRMETAAAHQAEDGHGRRRRQDARPMVASDQLPRSA